MGINNDVLGLVFANMHDAAVPELTKARTMGSVMFGGRYRLIDFPLSNFANSGIPEVGVITKSNYQSLLDHIGSGREWDLARKNGGLHLLPPFSHVGSGIYRGRLEALDGIWNFVEHSSADYVVMSDCDVATTIDFRPVVKSHIKSGADITAVYANYIMGGDEKIYSTIIEVDEENRVTDVLLNPHMSGEVKLSLNMFVVSKSFLRKIVRESVSRSLFSFEKDILQGKKNEYKIVGYQHKGYFSKISSMSHYYEANMELLNFENRTNLFLKNLPIYTKVKDNGPVKFGVKANVKNSLIADGCIIDGNVENSILFRGVKVGKGSTVKNCILMQDTQIDINCIIDSVITDKKVIIGNERILMGSKTYPVYIGKFAHML